MAAVAMESAKEHDANVAVIDVTQLEFKIPGCTGCQKCQHDKKFVCVIDDQIARSVATLPDYDVIVVVTPLYWWSYSAQMKIFIDRMYSLSKFTESGGVRTLLDGKMFAILATGGGPMEDNLDLLERQWRNSATMLGCRFLSCLFPNTAPEAGSLAKDPLAIQKAREFGRLLAATK